MSFDPHRTPDAPRLRIPGDPFRAMGALYLQRMPHVCREALAGKLTTLLANRGLRCHRRTVRRQLTGHVATVSPVAQQVMRELVLQAIGGHTDADIEAALAEAGLSVADEHRRPQYLPVATVVPLAELWLLLHPGRSRRHLARRLEQSLEDAGIRLNVNALQLILSGRQPTVREEVIEHLVLALGEHGITSASQAQERWQQEHEHLQAYREQCKMQSSRRLVRLATTWKLAMREPSSRKLAALVRQRLLQRGWQVSLHTVEEAIEGKALRVRTAMVTELEGLLREDLPRSGSLDLEQAPRDSRDQREQDLRWVRAEPIAVLARSWLAQHTEVTARQFCLRVAGSLQLMGYRCSLSTLQPILAGSRHRTRGFVYRAVLAETLGAGSPAAQGVEGASERDVLLAKRIESADRRLLALLLRCATTGRQLLGLQNKLEQDRLRPWKILVGSRPGSPEEEAAMRDRLLAALREVAVLDARCTSVRERLLIERSDEIVGELDRYAYRMASVLVDYRFDARQLRAWYDAYAALMGRLGLVDGRSPTLQAEETRRLEREAGLPLDQMSVTWSALQEAAHAGRQARNELVEAHQWLVATLARKYSWSGLEQADLVAEGNLGLMRAIDKYDYARGFRVSTYAAWWIRSRIERAIVNTGSNIRLPVHLADRIRKYRKAAQGPVSTAVHDPASADIAAATGLPPEELGSLLQLQRGTVSLQTPVGASGSTLEQVLADADAGLPSDAVSEGQVARRLRVVLQRLTPRETFVISMRFGLEDGEPHTLGDIGKTLGVSRERIRQIEEQALGRLRNPATAKLLRGLLDTDSLPRAAKTRPATGCGRRAIGSTSSRACSVSLR